MYRTKSTERGYILLNDVLDNTEVLRSLPRLLLIMGGTQPTFIVGLKRVRLGIHTLGHMHFSSSISSHRPDSPL